VEFSIGARHTEPVEVNRKVDVLIQVMFVTGCISPEEVCRYCNRHECKSEYLTAETEVLLAWFIPR
jgi:hypothetical protein